MAERGVRNPQVARDLGLRFSARLHELYGFQFEFLRVGSCHFLHDLDPLWRAPLLPYYHPHFLGSRPLEALSRSGGRRRSTGAPDPVTRHWLDTEGDRRPGVVGPADERVR